MSMRIPLFAANWKMNRSVADTADFVRVFQEQLALIPATLGANYEATLCPPATHLSGLATLVRGTALGFGAQNCGSAKTGAFTGEISPAVLKELGCRHVILGHSERRHIFREDDALVLSRLVAAVEEGLTPILCVGEVLQERRTGKTFNRVDAQLAILKSPTFPKAGWDRLVIAYEPVWAIGTGENASPAQAQEVHVFIRNWLGGVVGAKVAQGIRIQYGGSVKPENAQALMKEVDIDGFLVGGASLDPLSFAGVIRNGLKSRA